MTRGAFLRAMMAGLGASLVLTATMLALRLRLDAATFPERIDDAVLLLIPQWLFSDLLERFRFSAKPLLFVGLIVAQLLLATIGGILYGLAAVMLAARLDLTQPLFGGVVGLFLAVALDFAILPAFGAESPLARGTIVPALAMTVLPGLVYGLTLAVLLRLLSPPRPVRDPRTGTYGTPRRGFTRRSALAAAIPAVGAVVTAESLRRIVAGMGPRQPTAIAQVPATVAPTPGTTPTANSEPAGTVSALPGNTMPAPTATARTSATGITPSRPGSTPPVMPTATPVPSTPTPTVSPTPIGPGIPSGVAPIITPNRDFYTISKNFLDPLVRAEHWELAIGGLVRQPRTLRYGDVRALLAVSRPSTLNCISNEIGGALIGTAIWTGIPLAELLSGAEVRPEATHLIFGCEDGYLETLPVALALDPATLLVHTMNGEPLWEVHGFPARLIVPGRYGMKNPKWIARIEAVSRPPTGYWTERGWSPDEPIQTVTRIDLPGLYETIQFGAIPIGGHAFAGDRGISRVEVSTDGGTTWLPAELEAALGPATWVRWVYRWTPPGPGEYTIVARARDGGGTLQTATARKAGPGGATGYARRDVTIAP